MLMTIGVDPFFFNAYGIVVPLQRASYIPLVVQRSVLSGEQIIGNIPVLPHIVFLPFQMPFILLKHNVVKGNLSDAPS